MSRGHSWLENPFVLNLFDRGAKIAWVFRNVFSAKRLGESMNGPASFSQNRTYNQEAFRFLLKSESKRSERSGHSYHVLLVSQMDAQGAVVRMESDVAATVIPALARSLRETDYIGWYREGYVVGGVLTVVGRESAADVSSRLQSRLQEILRAELGAERSRRLQIRMCGQRETEGVESDEESCSAN